MHLDDKTKALYKTKAFKAYSINILQANWSFKSFTDMGTIFDFILMYLIFLIQIGCSILLVKLMQAKVRSFISLNDTVFDLKNHR